jgi:limonene 1,2-monooxygenase
VTKLLRFGAFCPPITSVSENPTLAIHRQLELVEHLDRLGFDEFWVGEHHTGGSELISAPEVFLAAAAERTKHIKLATGVTTLVYHHPYVVANRIVLLDHMTRGRVIFGTGPGSLAADSYHMGLDYQLNRARYADALEAVLLLLESDEPVNMKTDWFTLRDARLSLLPYQRPRMEVSTVMTMSPTGAKLAGRNGISLVSIGASTPTGFEALERTWDIVTEEADRYGKTVSRDGWRLVSFYHLADTEAQARKDVAYGLPFLIEYMSKTTGFPAPTDLHDINRTVDELNASGVMVIGTPDMMVEHMKGFQAQTGGFGGFLGFAHEAADREATIRSHELLMRDVVPEVQGTSQRPRESFQKIIGVDWASEVGRAQDRAEREYAEERATT